jgi:hypothetical protein
MNKGIETSYKLSLLDICLPDYFQGFRETESAELLSIPIDNSMTPQQVYKCLYEYWESTEGPLDDSWAFESAMRSFFGQFTGNMDCTREDFAACMGMNYASPIPEDDYSTEPVYAYFKLESE